jgi:hypothetical protein
MNAPYHSENDASDITPPADTGAAPIDPKETASRGKPPGQTEAGVQKPGPGGTLAGGEAADDADDASADDESLEEYDDPDGSLDAFD